MNSIRAAGPFGGPCSSNRIQMLGFGAVSNSKSSNDRKIARMARNLTIFGPNRSRRRELKFEKFSNERASGQTNDLYKSFSKVFRNFLRDPRSLDLNYRFALDIMLDIEHQTCNVTPPKGEQPLPHRTICRLLLQ